MNVDAAGAGLDEARLERIGHHLRTRYIEPGKIAGAQVAVVRGGVVGYFESFGVQDRERGIPVGDDAIWRLYSMTKPITGVAMMTLYEQAHFQLDDPVDRWIPEWKNMTVREADPNGGSRIVPAHRPPTIRDILTHTSGIGYGEGNGDLVLGERNWLADHDLASMSTAFGEWPLRFQPGQHWLYSHGMDIGARLVEIMSGLPYDEYLRTAVFEPLGMTDTDFWVPEDKVDRFAANYGRNGRKELVLMDDPTRSAYLRKPKLFNGGGGLVGTTADYIRFAAMLANGGELNGQRLLSPRTLQLMASVHIPASLPGRNAGEGYGLSVRVIEDAIAGNHRISDGSFGWSGAYGTHFWVDPQEDLIAVMMIQTPIRDMRPEFENAVMQAIVE